MNRKKILTAVGLMIVLCVFMTVGCSQKKGTEKDIEEKVEQEKLKCIGDEIDGENVYKVVLENKTEKNIVGFSIKDSSLEVFPENMLKEGDPFVKDEKRELYYDYTAAEQAAESQQEEGEVVLSPQYDIQLTFEDESVLVLSAFPFEDMEEGRICLEDEVAFLEYTSVETEEQVSTKEAELSIRAAAEAQRQAEEAAAAEAQRQAEEAAAAEAQRQAEEAAAAEAQRQAEEAAAAAKAQRQAEEAQRAANAQKEQQQSSSDEGCVGDGLVY